MMDFLKWASENPILSFLSIWAIATGVGNLGRIGSRRTEVKIKLVKEEES